MERVGLCKEARAAPENRRMVSCELDAAEALAVLGRFSDNSKRQLPTHHSQDKRIAAQQFNDCATSENTVEILPSLSSGKTINLVKSAAKPRQLKLTEDEKQERKVRRLLANREAARQTIRRRQAMFLELNIKVAQVSEENENLKKEKEVAVKEYQSLKYRNEFLKSELAKSMKAQSSGKCMQEDPKRPLMSSRVPNWFWPDDHPHVFPAFASQYSSKIPMLLYPPMNCFHSSCGAAEENGGNFHLSKKRVDGPCNNTKKKKSGVRGRPRLSFPSESDCNDGFTTLQYGDGHIFVPGLFCRVKPQSPPRNEDSPLGEMEDAFASTEARRRRKELMRLKGAPSRRSHAR